MKLTKKVVNIGSLTDSIGIEGDYLTSRPDGRLFYTHLVDHLGGPSSQFVYYLDFSKVDLMDSSFADEVFGSVVSARSRGHLELAAFVLVSINEISLDNLEQSLLSRPARETGLRNSVVACQASDGQISLIGKYEDHVGQTFALLNKGITLTTRDVADELDLGITAASTRLKVLFNLGLALRIEQRDGQGKQFVYHSVKCV